MRVAIAQINPCIGDLSGNVDRCLAAIERAQGFCPDLVVFPEMAIPGNPARDILLDPSFVEATCQATEDLARQTRSGPAIAVGTLMKAGAAPPHHPGLWDAAVLMEGGRIRMAAAKRILPCYDVFFDPRWFLPGPTLPPVDVAGWRVGFLVGEDVRDEGYPIHPAQDLVSAGADLLVAIDASPFLRGIHGRRVAQAPRRGCPLIYANLCGANDEIIYDGQSFALNEEGHLTAQGHAFEEDVLLVDLASCPSLTIQEHDPEEELYRALVLGVRDFCRKNRIAKAFLGLSGGVDSAVVAAIAAEALGPHHVTAIAMPSRYTDPRSTSCARDLSGALGIGFEIQYLEPLHVAGLASLASLGELEGIAAENLQARLRAGILMSYVNQHGGLLLNTSNKTEITLGYGTLYGDTAGAISPLGDVTKPEVYRLAHWISDHRAAIPSFILDRPPSAELRPNQVDPFDYPKVAPEVERLVQENRSDASLCRSEHKRRQMGVILKVRAKSFGTGRMMPIARR